MFILCNMCVLPLDEVQVALNDAIDEIVLFLSEYTYLCWLGYLFGQIYSAPATRLVFCRGML